MLVLLFSLGDERYAIAGEKVVEVVPLTDLRVPPQAPEYVAGLLNYRGTIAPVIDLCRRATGSPCRRLLSSRIVILRYRALSDEENLLGVMAESVTDTAQVEEGSLSESGVRIQDSAYLGPVSLGPGDTPMVQFVDVDQLIPDDVRDILFVGDEVAGDANSNREG